VNKVKSKDQKKIY